MSGAGLLYALTPSDGALTFMQNVENTSTSVRQIHQILTWNWKLHCKYQQRTSISHSRHSWGYYSQIFKRHLQNANIPVLNSWMKAVCFLKLTLRFSHVLGLKSESGGLTGQKSKPKQSVMFKGNLGIPKEDLKQWRNWDNVFTNWLPRSRNTDTTNQLEFFDSWFVMVPRRGGTRPELPRVMIVVLWLSQHQTLTSRYLMVYTV